MFAGTIKRWNTERGFGFAQRDDGQPDVFVHINAVEDDTIEALAVGQRVNFELGEHAGRPCAVKVQLI